MARRLSFFAPVCLIGVAAANPTTYDAGSFSLSLDLVPGEWGVDTHPELNYARLRKFESPGMAGGTSFASFVYVDRIADPKFPTSVERWFADYLKRTTGFLRERVFDGPRSFRAAKLNPLTISGKKLYRFDMTRRLLNRPAARAVVEEEAVVYFLILPEFEKHRTFFAFTGRQILSRDLGHRSELGEVEKIIASFKLTVERANKAPEPTPGSVTPRAGDPKVK